MNEYFDIYLIKGFAKKPNSTKRPDIEINKDVTVKQRRVRGRLRDGCSIFNPTFEIEWDLTRLKTQEGSDYPDPQYRTADIFAYNYAFVQLFGDFNTATYGDYYTNVTGRYYYLTDIIPSTTGLYNIVLQADPLATFRDPIGESTQYIVRSALGNYSKIDTALPISAVRENTIKTGTNLFAQGGFTVTVLAGAETSSGLAYAINGDTIGKITKASNWVKKGEAAHPTPAEWETLDVLSCVKGQYVLPVTEDTAISPETTHITLGDFECGVDISSIPKTTKLTATASVTVPEHPDAKRFPFVNCGAYCDYKIYVPYLGIIPVSGDAVHGGDTVSVTVTTDPLAGTGAFSVKTNNSILSESVITIAGYSGFGGAIGNSGVATAIGGAARTGIITSGVISGASALGGGAAAALAATNPATAAIGLTAAAVSAVFTGVSTTQAIDKNGIETAISSAQTTTHSISGGGGRFLNEYRVTMMGSFVRINSRDTVTGKPDCTIRKIKESGDGYISVSNPHLDLTANLAEIQAIYQYMEGGFYYE